MAIDPIAEIRSHIAKTLGVQEEQVECTLDGKVLVVMVTGELGGHSVRNAARRRKEATHIAKRLSEERGFESSLSFTVHDPLSVMEDAVRKTTEIVLGLSPDAVHISINRNGETKIFLSTSKTIDDAQAQLTRVITPILKSAGLSLVAISLVSAMADNVSDARLLRLVKIFAPANAASLSRLLSESDDTNISADFVHRRLDILRQKGFLVYVGDRKFALTLKGLAVVPTSWNRRSSDIERVLALARNKW